MADEIQPDLPEVEVVSQEPTEREYSPIEKKAMEMGWKPLEEFDGDPAEFRSAETFVALAPLYEKISQTGKENKRLKEAMQHMASMFDKIKEQSYQQALKTLREERKAALQEGDIDRVDLIEQQIDNVKEQQQLAKEQAPVLDLDDSRSSPVHPQFQQFLERNRWYQSDEDMTAWADARGVKLAQQGKDRNEVLEILEKEVKKVFPHKFTNPNRERASAVEGGDNTKTSNSKQKVLLSEDERRIMKTIVRSGVMTEAEYLAQYAKVR